MYETEEAADGFCEYSWYFWNYGWDHRTFMNVEEPSERGGLRYDSAEHMPTDQFHSETERAVTLSHLEREKLLSANPAFVSVIKAEYFDNYDLPCPVRVTLRSADGELIDVVLRRNRHGDVDKEVKMFSALAEAGLPVPKLLAGPFQNDEGESEAVYSLLPGENLQKLGMRSEADLQAAKVLLVQAVLKLMEATPFIEQQEIGRTLPRITLVAELAGLSAADNPWLETGEYRSAMERLRPILSEINTPLVLSNGDYQPGNFLTQDGQITGYLDFESASFQDPMMGFVKYPIYDLFPLARTDVVDMFLKRKGFTRQEFGIRLALGCLKTLKEEIPLTGGDTEAEAYRARVLSILRANL